MSLAFREDEIVERFTIVYGINNSLFVLCVFVPLW